jgi:hypothetical protein
MERELWELLVRHLNEIGQAVGKLEVFDVGYPCRLLLVCRE